MTRISIHDPSLHEMLSGYVSASVLLHPDRTGRIHPQEADRIDADLSRLEIAGRVCREHCILASGTIRLLPDDAIERLAARQFDDFMERRKGESVTSDVYIIPSEDGLDRLRESLRGYMATGETERRIGSFVGFLKWVHGVERIGLGLQWGPVHHAAAEHVVAAGDWGVGG